MTLVDEFANYISLPSWFAGGLLGMVVTVIVLAVVLHYFKAKGIFLSVLVVGLSAMNWQVFYWPFWAALVTGIGFLWGINRGV